MLKSTWDLVHKDVYIFIVQRVYRLIPSIYFYFFPKSKSRSKAVVHSKVGALAMFTKKKATCIGCKSVLPEAEQTGAVCSHCGDRENEIYMTEVMSLNKLEGKFARLWTQCQRYAIKQVTDYLNIVICILIR